MRSTKTRFDNRFTTVLAAAAIIGLVGAGAGYAAGTIGSAEIEDGSVRSIDVKDKSIKLKDIGKRAQTKLKGQQGPAGPVGPSSIVAVKDLNGAWKARATDTAGVKMVGDGIQFGPFANGGGCATPGTEFGRLDFDGLNGKTLNSLKSLVFHAPLHGDQRHRWSRRRRTFRVYFSGNRERLGGQSAHLLGRTPSPTRSTSTRRSDARVDRYVRNRPASTTTPANYPGRRGALGVVPGGPTAARTITNINVLSGCQAGTNLTVTGPSRGDQRHDVPVRRDLLTEV